MDSLLIILIVVLIALNIGVLLLLFKNKQEKTENPTQSLKDEFNAFKESFSQSFGHMSKDIAKDMSGALTRVDEKVGVFNKQVETLNKSQDNFSRILAGVKQYGVLAEFSLASLLKDLLPASQYIENVKTKPDETGDTVEFAIKLQDVLVPVDSHWPIEKFKEIDNAYQNIKFEKEISIDNKYLFTVKQTIINNSEKTYNFYPYGQIIRNEIPEITNFFILHEGPLGVFDSELVEKDYDDIQDKSYSINADRGFVGITDKFWITSLIPQENRKFRADFDYKNKFRTNFIETSATEIGANETKSNEIKILLAAKEVRIIDEYAKKLNIEKLDLVIDWGCFDAN